MIQLILKYIYIGFFIFPTSLVNAQQQPQWLQFQPNKGIANGKHIVLIAGDEEYRTEESLPMLAKILTQHHGFITTVLFSINPKTGLIDPNYKYNIPGMEHLSSADLLIIATRFRELPNQQMKYFDEYLKAGKPVMGFRTATHAFNFEKNPNSPYAKYGYSSKQKGWEGGFGKQILGETWVSHHGKHGSEGTRGLVNGLLKEKNHPILKGVTNIWGPTDVYTVNRLSADAEVLVWGQTTMGMTAASLGNWEKTIMPIAWTKSYVSESGNKGKVFTTTMGSSIDFLSEDLRRLIVNACYWAVGLENKSADKINVDIIGAYHPTKFGLLEFKNGKRPQDLIN